MPTTAALAVAMLLGIGLVGLTWRRPEIGAVVLVAALPLQPAAFGWLIAHGVPSSAVLLLRYWHSAVLVVLAARAVAKRSGRMQPVELVAVGYIGLIAVFTLLPQAPNLIGRIDEARPFAGIAILFLVGRWLPMAEWASRGIQAAVLVVGVIMGIGAAFNQFNPDGFTRWVYTSGILQYQGLLGEPVRFAVIYSNLAGHSVVRAGSVFLSPLVLAHFMLVPTGIAVGLAAAGRIRRWQTVAALVAAAGLMMTLTRSAILAIVVMAVLVAAMTGRGRGRFLVWMSVAALVLYPLATLLTIGDQIQAGLDVQQSRTAGHLADTTQAIGNVLANPLGLGLLGKRLQFFGANGVPVTVAENWYLQSGLIFGLLGTILPVLLVTMTMRELWIRGRVGDPDAAAAFGALGALGLAALLLYAFGDISTTYPVFLLAGLATRRREPPPQEGERQAAGELARAPAQGAVARL